jgi:hypothetical protein
VFPALRQDPDPQVHPIGNEKHRVIHALLTDSQKQLERAMWKREREDTDKGRQLCLRKVAI